MKPTLTNLKPSLIDNSSNQNQIKDIQENKGFVHVRYVIPLKSYELETFGQIELDNFRSIFYRCII